MKYDKPYEAPILTVDLVLFKIVDGTLRVLLLKRPKAPFKNMMALPGGYNPAGETTREALRRIIEAKVGVNIENLDYVEQLRAFDTVGRDPRGHAVSVVYLAAADEKLARVGAGAGFYDVDNLPELAYDHAKIIELGRRRMVDMLDHTTVAGAFLPEIFTMGELRAVYAAVTGEAVDKRNFQKAIIRRNVLTPTGNKRPTPGSRPALTYRFSSPKIENFHSDLD
jgi:8-oxo-dGTP diphosphatase